MTEREKNEICKGYADLIIRKEQLIREVFVFGGILIFVSASATEITIEGRLSSITTIKSSIQLLPYLLFFLAIIVTGKQIGRASCRERVLRLV